MNQPFTKLRAYKAPEAELLETSLDRTVLGIYSEQQTGSSTINDLEDEDSWDPITWN